MDKIIEQFEQFPAARLGQGDVESLKLSALCSIAISLKRIADSLDATMSAEYQAGVAALRKSATP